MLFRSEAAEAAALCAALAEVPEPPPELDLEALTARARASWRAIFEHRHGAESRVFLGIYGTDAEVETTLMSYRALALSLGWKLEVYACWLDEAQGKVAGAWERATRGKGPSLGVEVDLTGVAARGLLLTEAGLHLFSEGSGDRRLGVKVVVHALTEVGAPQRDVPPQHRPRNAARASILEGAPRRLLQGDVLKDRELRDELPERGYGAALTEHLRRRYEALIFDDLVT